MRESTAVRQDTIALCDARQHFDVIHFRVTCHVPRQRLVFSLPSLSLPAYEERADEPVR